jgi:hypothetical protein
MPRTYSFDHFQVPAAEPRGRSPRRQHKQKASGSRKQVVPHEEGLHYGRSHAETQEMFHARAQPSMMLGELAGTKFAHPPPTEVLVTNPEATRARDAEPPAVRSPRGTAPIGALPGVVEELPERGRLQDLLDEASRQMQVLQTSMGDVTRAAARLASLPVEVARLAARRLGLVHG